MVFTGIWEAFTPPTTYNIPLTNSAPIAPLGDGNDLPSCHSFFWTS